MVEVFSSWSDLTYQPIGHLDIDYFTEGSNFIWDGMCFAGYAIVTLDSVIEDFPQPIGTSAQKAEFVTFTQALLLTAGVWVNIYTDSKHAFTIIHVHGVLYKERGFINLGGKSMKYGQKILELLDAI
jgi:hypothetical protein